MSPALVSRDVWVIFVAAGARQGGPAETDIKALQGFTNDFQQNTVTTTFRKCVVPSPVCPDSPNLLSLPGVKRQERQADNSPPSSAKFSVSVNSLWTKRICFM